MKLKAFTEKVEQQALKLKQAQEDEYQRRAEENRLAIIEKIKYTFPTFYETHQEELAAAPAVFFKDTTSNNGMPGIVISSHIFFGYKRDSDFGRIYVGVWAPTGYDILVDDFKAWITEFQNVNSQNIEEQNLCSALKRCIEIINANLDRYNPIEG